MPFVSRLRPVLSALILAGLLYLGVRGVGPLPPLGPLLDPVSGVWGVAATAELPETETVELPGLGDGVRVLYDDRGVPHIFAGSGEDAARALGWVSARDRLFEMELRWRTTAGRLSELVGAQALEFDRSMRRLGLAWAGDREFAAADPESREMRELRAYAEGVNAWIEGMGRGDLPLEYRILGARPAPWRPVYSVYFLKLMGWNLAYSSSMDLEHAEAVALVGRDAADALFPVHSPIQEPIQPDPQDGPRFLPVELPPPGTPDTAAARATALRAAAVGRALGPLTDRGLVGPLANPKPDGELLVGSNNWAVAPERTASGHALLAGDPHLELTLPSIWYEAHLVVPGELDVYGVNMPSVPRILIGFNRDVAWSFTNTGADVLDYYEEEVDDPEDPVRYRLDGVWRPLDTRVEEVRGPGGEVLAVDTLYMTHRGPVIEEAGRYLSMSWTVLGPAAGGTGPAGGEDLALRRVMEAESVEEWLESMGSYQAPAQNGIVADRSGTIAIRSNGLFPLHPDADGRDVEDGSTTAPDWNGFWPVEDYPQAMAPEQGYLASANQEPLAPEAYPGSGASPSASYLGASWTSPWRAIRINELLRADSAVTPEAMGRYHVDPGNPRADYFVPAFLAAAERSDSGEESDGVSEGDENASGGNGEGPVQGDHTVQEAARLLAEWDRRYTLDNEAAVLFEYAMEALVDRTWDELERLSGPTGVESGGGDPPQEEPTEDQPPGDEPGEGRTADPGPDRVATPSEAILLGLLADPGSSWWDHRGTPEVREGADDILRASLVEGYRSAVERHGPREDGGWRWEDAWAMDIWHMLNLPSLSELGVPVQGGDGTLNPLYSPRGTSGASWRMVVEMGPEVRGWTIYPGGQSGNPVSPWYADRIGPWSRGELEPALFPRTASELNPDRVASTLELEPAP